MPRKVFQTTSDLPDEVRDFLLDSDAYDQVDAIAEKYKLPVGGGDLLLDIAKAVTLGQTTLTDTPKEVEKMFKVDAEKAKLISVELAGARLLPIHMLVGDVAEQIESWGGDANAFSGGVEIDIKMYSPQTVIKQVLREAGLTISNIRLQHRLEAVLADFVAGIKPENETRDTLIKSQKVGGLELDENVAGEVISLVQEKTKDLPIALNETQTFVPKSEETAAKSRADHFTDTDAQDVKKEQTKIEEHIVALPILHSPKEAADRAVSETLSKFGAVIKTPELQKRFASLVETRMRDVRNPYELRSHLEKKENEGGVGLFGSTLAEISQIIETVFNDLQNDIKKIGNQMKEEHAAGIQQKKEIQDEQVKRETQILSKRYIDLTGRAPEDITEPAAPSLTRTTVSADTKTALDQSEKRINTEKVKDVILSSQKLPKRISPKVSDASMRQSQGKPRMQDILPGRTLSGPIEEIKSISLLDFRRMGKDPKDVIVKIKDKVDLLEDQGHAMRVKGVQAWRDSEIHRLYLTLSHEALVKGTPVTQLIEERKKAGEEVLTNEEVNAIVILNSQLRF